MPHPPGAYRHLEQPKINEALAAAFPFAFALLFALALLFAFALLFAVALPAGVVLFAAAPARPCTFAIMSASPELLGGAAAGGAAAAAGGA